MPILYQQNLETVGHPQMGGLFTNKRFINRRFGGVAGGSSIVTATDDFNRANANPISSPGSDGIITWVSGPGSFADIQIVSNACLRSTTNGGGIVTVPIFDADQMATITFADTPTGCGVMCRMPSSSSSNGYYLYVSALTTLQYFHHTDGGTFRQIGANLIISALSAGDSISLKVTGTGTVTLEAFRNGVSVDSRTDSTDPYNSGQPGIRFGGANSINSFFATEV